MQIDNGNTKPKYIHSARAIRYDRHRVVQDSSLHYDDNFSCPTGPSHKKMICCKPCSPGSFPLFMKRIKCGPRNFAVYIKEVLLPIPWEWESIQLDYPADFYLNTGDGTMPSTTPEENRLALDTHNWLAGNSSEPSPASCSSICHLWWLLHSV